MAKKMLGADYLLLLLYLNDQEPIKGAVRLIKMMFLFNKQISETLKRKGLESEQLPSFIAYNYGPFSKDVYEQIELFTSIGFVSVRDISTKEEMSGIDDVVETEFIDECYQGDSELKTENNFWEYRITDVGKGFVEKKLLADLTDEQRGILEAFKRKITEMPIKQILYYVYTNYPDYTEKSLIKDEVLDNGNEYI